MAVLLLLAGVAVLFYYGWPQRWYEAWTARVSLVTPTPAPAYPAVPEARPEVADVDRPLPPAVGEPAAPPPAPAIRIEQPAPARPAHAVPTFSGQGVPAAPEDRADAVDEPGPLGAAQRRAVTKLTPRVVALDGLAEKVDGQMRVYIKVCHPEQMAVVPPFSRARRDWPVPLLLDASIAPTRDERAGADRGGCVAQWDELRGRADQVASRLDEMRRLAASEGILPGHVREALAEHGLDGWERYPVP